MIGAKLTLRKPARKIRIDKERVKAFLPAIVRGMMLERVADGRDIDGKPFRAYSKTWFESLQAMGEGTSPDLRLTGGLMNSLRLLKVKESGTKVVLTFGPDAATSPQVRPPDHRERSKGESKALDKVLGAAERARAKGKRLTEKQHARLQASADAAVAKETRARAIRTGERGPPHNLVGLWLHRGTNRMPPRKWLGLDPEQRRRLRAQLERLGIFKVG